MVSSDNEVNFLANCSIIFTEFPLLERPGRARSAGFDAIEFWWPFDDPVPHEREVTRFVDAIGEAGVDLVCMNLFAGDLPAGDRGILSWPGREAEFFESVEVAADIGRRLSIRGFNALYGNRQDDLAADLQYEVARSNLAIAMNLLCSSGAVVLLEALSGAPRYPLVHGSDVCSIIGDCDDRRLGMLADLYHLAVNGDDLDRLIDENIESVYHVQIADAPGRHEPGSGVLVLDQWLKHLRQLGYAGWVGLEYVPSASSLDSFEFLRSYRRILNTGGQSDE